MFGINQMRQKCDSNIGGVQANGAEIGTFR
jgi:hypothetical protein